MKADRQRIVCLTCYDASLAQILEHAGVDVVLVGDSLGMVIQGQSTTIPVTIEDMIYHARCVQRGLRRALLLVDLPFLSYASPAQALENAARLMQEAGAQMVKLEGGRMQVGIVRYLAERGVPVCAHLGLKPQSVHKLGGYRVQGRDAAEAEQMLLEARDLEQAGADMLLLECVPVPLAEEITDAVDVPVIGIGAGPRTDGQVLVLYDILGATAGKPPRFAANFLAGHDSLAAAVRAYVEAVRTGAFPRPEHCF
jgi:3-methyl-2-oxobutanoate hydroxymethyltransferase